MQERCEETVSIPEGAEGKLIAEVAAMELAENREVEVKQEEEMQSYWKERMHHPHPHHPRYHPHHHHPLHHLHHLHPRHHPHHHHHMEKKWEKKWEKLEKKRMKMCGGGKKKGSELGGWNSKFVGKLKHKLEKIDWKVESLQEKKLYILRRIQEIEEEEERKKNEGVQVPTAPTQLPTHAA